MDLQAANYGKTTPRMIDAGARIGKSRSPRGSSENIPKSRPQSVLGLVSREHSITFDVVGGSFVCDHRNNIARSINRSAKGTTMTLLRRGASNHCKRRFKVFAAKGSYYLKKISTGSRQSRGNIGRWYFWPRGDARWALVASDQPGRRSVTRLSIKKARKLFAAGQRDFQHDILRRDCTRAQSLAE